MVFGPDAVDRRQPVQGRSSGHDAPPRVSSVQPKRRLERWPAQSPSIGLPRPQDMNAAVPAFDLRGGEEIGVIGIRRRRQSGRLLRIHDDNG